jgi:hypothetical protein
MSLHKEYAITPEVFDPDCHESVGEHRLLMNQLKSGLVDHKFLRCDKDQWLSEVTRNVSGSMAGKAILEYLIKSKRLLHDTHSRTSHDWVSHFEASHRERPMSGLLMDDLSDISDGVALPHARVSEMTPDYPSWWYERAQSVYINCSAYKISDCFSIFLRNARQIHLIDKYFDLGEHRYSKVFREMHTKIMANPHRPQVFIHSSYRNFYGLGDPWEDAVEQRFKSRRPNSPPSRMRLFVCVWDACMFSKVAHDRCFLTDLGGCQIGRGFVDEPNDQTIITALSEEDRTSFLAHFLPEKNTTPNLLLKCEI